MIKNIGIIGVGGVGGYFGGKLCQLLPSNQDLQIYFIARGKHLAEIKKNGLYLCTADEGDMTCKPTLATDDFSELPTLDLCLLCVKSYDLDNVLTNIKNKISDKTLILPLLNGIDIYERIREIIDTGIVFPSCVYVGTHIEKYGKVTQKGGACKILFGKDIRHQEFIPDEIFDLFKRSKIKYEWFDNPYQEIWGKYIFIASFGLVTACFNKTVGEVMDSKELSSYVLAIMKEIVSLADKKNIVFPKTIIENSFNKGKNFPHHTKTSFQRDFECSDKPDERDLFGGTIIRLGKRLNIDTPTTNMIFNKLEHIKSITKQST